MMASRHGPLALLLACPAIASRIHHAPILRAIGHIPVVAAPSPVAVPASPAPIEEWRATFDRLDRDSDGALSYKESREFIEHVAPAIVDEATFRSYDSDDDGRLDFEELDVMLKTVLQLPVDSVLMRRERYSSVSLWLSSLRNLRRSTVLQVSLGPLTHPPIHSLARSLAHSLTHSFNHSLTLTIKSD